MLHNGTTGVSNTFMAIGFDSAARSWERLQWICRHRNPYLSLKAREMPKNKAALVRYKIINDCLRNTMRNWTKQDLIDMVNIKLQERGMSFATRQFNYDINDMRSEFDAPIETRREGRQHFYYYSNPTFSIEEQRLSEDDLQLLQQSVHLLQQIKGFSISEDIAEVVTRLESRIKTDGAGPQSVISFENPPDMVGIDHLEQIYPAILRKNVLKIAYKPYKAPEAQEHIIHPYYLKEYNNRWFLFGWNDGKQRVANMALDRISSIKVANKPYQQNTSFDPELYFKNIIGVTLPPEPIIETIVVKVAADRAPYLASKPLHHSQIILRTNKDSSMSFQFQLVINKELITQLLSFGSMIEVKKPEHLRVNMMNNLQAALRLYAH